MKKLILALAIILLAFGCSSGPTVLPLLNEGEEVVLYDSFEDYAAFNPWAAVGESWGDNDSSTSVELSDIGVTDGAASLACNYTMILRPDLGDDTIGQATFNYDSPELNDWTGIKAMAVDFTNNTGGPIKVYAAVCTGASWFWQETYPPIELGEGTTQNVRFEFTENIKSADTDWQPAGTEIRDLQTVMRITIRIQAPIDTTNTVYIDNVRLIK